MSHFRVSNSLDIPRPEVKGNDFSTNAELLILRKLIHEETRYTPENSVHTAYFSTPTVPDRFSVDRIRAGHWAAEARRHCRETQSFVEVNCCC